jgi:hypothetical protein
MDMETHEAWMQRQGWAQEDCVFNDPYIRSLDTQTVEERFTACITYQDTFILHAMGVRV